MPTTQGQILRMVDDALDLTRDPEQAALQVWTQLTPGERQEALLITLPTYARILNARRLHTAHLSSRTHAPGRRAPR